MPISKIEIENFQAHKNLELDFGKQITSITGPSDRGKSAIIRALIWVITNRPTGDSFIRYGADECQVTVHVDGHVVQRIKGKKRNVYILDGVEYKALKTDVPEEIQKVFHIGLNNMQSQFDPIFWFSETAGEVGRNLNQIVNLDIIDHVLGKIQSKNRTVKTELDVLENMICEQEKALENADDIEAVLGIIKRTEAFQSDLNMLQEKERNLSKTVEDAGKITTWMQKAQVWETAYSELEAIMDEYCEMKSRAVSLSDILEDAQDLQRTISQHQIPDSLFTLIGRVEEGEKELRQLRSSWKSLYRMISGIYSTEEDIKKAEETASEAEKDLHRVIANNVCPLCGRKG